MIIKKKLAKVNSTYTNIHKNAQSKSLKNVKKEKKFFEVCFLYFGMGTHVLSYALLEKQTG